MIISSNVFIAGVKSSRIWETPEEKKKQTQEEDYEFEELIEEENEKSEDIDVENIYG